MNQIQKLEALKTAMEVKTRPDGTEFTSFSDTAPRELVDLFLEHFDVRDTDYEIFSDACDVFADNELKDIQDDNIDTEFASVYNATRLSYLNIYNDDEIADIFREYSCETISQACACWYDNQVRDAIQNISEWVTNDQPNA